MLLYHKAKWKQFSSFPLFYSNVRCNKNRLQSPCRTEIFGIDWFLLMEAIFSLVIWHFWRIVITILFRSLWRTIFTIYDFVLQHTVQKMLFLTFMSRPSWLDYFVSYFLSDFNSRRNFFRFFIFSPKKYFR